LLSHVRLGVGEAAASTGASDTRAVVVGIPFGIDNVATLDFGLTNAGGEGLVDVRGGLGGCSGGSLEPEPFIASDPPEEGMSEFDGVEVEEVFAEEVMGIFDDREDVAGAFCMTVMSTSIASTSSSSSRPAPSSLLPGDGTPSPLDDT
jgi:hypothetical protein